MAKIEKPEYYQTPLRKKSDIVAFLNSQNNWHSRSYDYGRGGSIFCFDVKLRSLDLSFSHLLEKYKDSGYCGDKCNDEGWIDECRRIYYETGLGELETEAIDRARDNFLDGDMASFRQLWDGTDIDVEYAFVGRSGGWLAIEKFEGHDLRRNQDFNEWDYDDLRKLYGLVVMLSHDLSGHKPDDEVEYQAAFHFFENYCSRVSTADTMLGAGI